MSAAVEIRGISKRFGGLRAVDDVSLFVAEGERRALIGPNGAGKTTLFNCVAGTLRATAGRIAVFGTDVTALPERRRASLGVGRTFQISNVFVELPAVENVILAILGNEPRKWLMHRPLAGFPELAGRAREALSRVGLAARADDSVSLLSYGERRQLELALALAATPKILLLDEPCAGLSPAERERFSRMIAELPRSITVLMIEHDMDVALGLADRVAVLHHGRLICEGAPAEVEADPQVREVYFGHA
jgi:branched-chain amino acid transport system ATP-binding protein